MTGKLAEQNSPSSCTHLSRHRATLPGCYQK